MIRVQGVSKKFRIYATPVDRLKEKLFRRSYHHEYSALSDISFEVGPGETLGIVGENGAGKSTLLKILSGVLLPDNGIVEVSGKVTGLLELGTGFNPELTGLQNIFMNGTFFRMSHDEIEAKKDTIIDFAELGDFINEPIKTYSSGMLMRLGFAIAIHADPECFLVDEALSVGDAYFQQKCIRKIQEFKDLGGSIIFVSHDTNAVLTLCDHAILLSKGVMISYGLPQSIVELYISNICIQSHLGTKKIEIESCHNEKSNYNISTGEIELISLRLMNDAGESITSVRINETICVSLKFRCKRYIEKPVFGILLRNRYGQSIFGTNSHLMQEQVTPLSSDMVYEVMYQMCIPLQPDEYTITIAIDNKPNGVNSFNEYLLRLHDVGTLKVIGSEKSTLFEGIVHLNPVFSIHNSCDNLTEY
jgi:lipopolysaccharide transport system ATP-binding protein